GGGNHQHIGKP
nr:Chain C, Rpl8 peptide [Homo sapiens]4Y3O_D Chain D, Rpl8 peptide [Homo sapiens]